MIRLHMSVCSLISLEEAPRSRLGSLHEVVGLRRLALDIPRPMLMKRSPGMTRCDQVNEEIHCCWFLSTATTTSKDIKGSRARNGAATRKPRINQVVRECPRAALKILANELCCTTLSIHASCWRGVTRISHALIESAGLRTTCAFLPRMIATQLTMPNNGLLHFLSNEASQEVWRRMREVRFHTISRISWIMCVCAGVVVPVKPSAYQSNCCGILYLLHSKSMPQLITDHNPKFQSHPNMFPLVEQICLWYLLTRDFPISVMSIFHFCLSYYS